MQLDWGQSFAGCEYGLGKAIWRFHSLMEWSINERIDGSQVIPGAVWALRMLRCGLGLKCCRLGLVFR